MTSYGPLTSSVMWPFEAAYVTSYRSSIETKPVSRLVFEIFSFANFYVMTSPLTPRRLDRLSVWIVYTHYAVDDYVKRWSNFVRNCRRNRTLKVVMSRLWRHRVTWRHTWRHRCRHHSTAFGHFPIGPNRKVSAICNSFRDIWPQMLWIYDVITDVMTSGSTICVDPLDTRYRRALC